MPTNPSTHDASRPVGQLSLFLLFVVLAALGLFLIMRAVTPMRDRDTSPILPTSTVPTATPPVVVPTSTPARPTPSTPVPPMPTTSTPTLPVVRPRPANAVCDEQNFICVNAPGQNDLISNPTVVTGTAIAFENTFLWRIEDGRGTVIAGSHAMANAPDIGQPGPFMIRAFWDVVPQTPTGTLVVYEASARDGEPIHVVRLPVRFATRAAATRRLYFVPEALSAKMDCRAVEAHSVTVPGSATPIEATLRALLSYDDSRTPPGLKTSIPSGTGLVSITVNNGLAKVIFDANLEREVGGSCRVGAIRAQITQTLLQFPSIQRVDLSVEGKTPEETLQP